MFQLSQTNDHCTSCKIILNEKGIIDDKYLNIFIPSSRLFRVGREMERGTFIRLKVLDHALDILSPSTVVSLGSGYDSRFCRALEKEGMERYVDVDLPEVIKKKKEMLTKYYGVDGVSAGHLSISTCVGRDSLEWLDQFSKMKGVLFLMECFLMYLKLEDQRSLLKKISSSYPRGTKILLFNSVTYKNNPFSSTMLMNLSPLIDGTITEIDSFFMECGWSLREMKYLNSTFTTKDILGMYEEDLKKLGGPLLCLDEYEEWDIMGLHYYFAILDLL